MAINIEEHELVPKHEVMDEEDVDTVLETYNITISNLPKISRKDPMARRLDAEVGDVIKITRNSPTAGEAVYYRHVVEA